MYNTARRKGALHGMERTETGAMYGREGSYFEHLPKGHENYVWMELIGFDNTAEDFGVERLLETMGFYPAAFLLLMSSIDLINLHKGMDEQYVLDPYYCSYGGHPYNDERSRQQWTNLQLSALLDQLHAKGIAAYVSMFDFVSPNGSLANRHPELKTVYYLEGKKKVSGAIYMTKRFADGTFYEDFFLNKATEFLKDYGFDGIHLADGLCRPRLPLQWCEFSEDMLEQAGIVIPADCHDPSVYVLEHHRADWIRFCRDRWMNYLEHVVNGFAKAGFGVIVNSTWTKDPMESVYRYGIDYDRVCELPITAMVVENGAPTISIIDVDANAGYRQSYEDRKMVHHAFRASLMTVAACNRNRIPLRPLFPVRDTMEQYDVIHHLPTALQRHGAAILNSFLWEKDGKLKPVVKGNTYCLGDGLSADNWKFLRLCSDNAYTEHIEEVPGSTVIWSEDRNKKEVEALIRHRTWSTAKWMAELLRRGAAVHKIAHIQELDLVRGDIVVPNPGLMSGEELAAIRAYDRGRILYLEMENGEEDYTGLPNPVGMGFPYPLFFAEVDEEYVRACTAYINGKEDSASVFPGSCQDECHVQEIKISPNCSRFLVDNEEYYYTVPEVNTGRTIKSVIDITKVQGYGVKIQEQTFKTLVPLRGVAVLEAEFEE